MKRRPAFDDAQLDLGFGVPERASSDGALASLPRETASAVAAILRKETRNRFEVGAAVSALLDAEVSKWMLDKYASEASVEHEISFSRMLVLVAATGEYDILRALLRKIGCSLTVGEEVYLLEIGHLEAEIRQKRARLKQVKSVAEPIMRGRHK